MSDDADPPEPSPEKHAAPKKRGGYRCPPEDKQFRKGVSGNPKGRPRMKRPAPALPNPYHKLLLEMFDAERKLPDGTSTSLIEVLLNRSAKLASTQDAGLAQLSARERASLRREYAAAAEAAQALSLGMLTFLAEYKHEKSEDFMRAKRAGQRPPDIVPHPDHIDLSGPEPVMRGPIDRENRVVWELLKHHIRIATAEAKELRAEVRARPADAEAREQLVDVEVHLRALKRLVPKGWRWNEDLWTLENDFASFARFLDIKWNPEWTARLSRLNTGR